MLMGERGRSLVNRMPQGRVLTETDGPFAQIEGAIAMPWDISKAIDMLASIWNLTPAEAERTVEHNLRNLIKANS